MQHAGGLTVPACCGVDIPGVAIASAGTVVSHQCQAGGLRYRPTDRPGLLQAAPELGQGRSFHTAMSDVAASLAMSFSTNCLGCCWLAVQYSTELRNDD